MKYFVNCKILEDLKKEYKKLALQYHPDRPQGNLKIMQDINSEYDIIFIKLKNIHNSEAKTEAEQTTETASEFKNIIDELINCQGLEIEICGSWVWLGGNTKQYKDIIKSLGFWWAKNKEKWYKKPENYISHKHKSWDMETIRNTYGSQKIETKKSYAIA